MSVKTAASIVVLLSASMTVLGADPSDLEPNLGFEGAQAGALPPGWRGGPLGSPLGTLFVDEKVFHGGASAGRIERTAESKGDFSTFTASIPMDFAGKAIELRGFLKTENVEGGAGLWLREDGESGSVAFDNMQKRSVQGTTDWTEYTIRLPVEPAGRKLFFGALLLQLALFRGFWSAWIQRWLWRWSCSPCPSRTSAPPGIRSISRSPGCWSPRASGPSPASTRPRSAPQGSRRGSRTAPRC
jgi:hypothetical protein